MQRRPVRKLTCLVLTAGMLGAGAVGLAAAPASATTTTVIVGSGSVAPGNPAGQWGLEPGAGTGTYGFVSGPAPTPGGSGSLALGIATGQHESFFNYSYGACTNPPTCSTLVPANATPIANIDTLGYSVYRTSGTSYPTFNIEVLSAGTTGFTSFVFIPNVGLETTGAWQTWNPMDPSQGAWWSSHALSTAPFNCGAFGCSATWSQVKSGFPNAVVVTGLGPNVGTDTNFAGNVDNVTVGVSGATKVYDFEPNCTTTCYVNAATGSDFATGLAGDPLKTIQAGVDTVSPGGTVVVATGTYAENVIVPKSVDITGAGAGATIVEPAVANPDCNGGAATGSLCSPPGNTASNVFLIRASNVTIDHLTVDGHNPALSGPANDGGVYAAARNGIIEDYNAGVFNNTSVHDVTVQNIYLRGLYASSGGTGFNFTNDVVTNVQGDPTASIAIFNFGGSGIITGNHVSNSLGGIQSNWSSGTSYTNNVVTSSGSGVESDNNGGFGGASTADTISGNNVSGCTSGGYGVTVFVPYLNVTVTNNTVSGCDNGLVALASCDLSGTNNCPGSAIPTTTYSNNTVTDTAGGKGLYITTNSMGFGDGEVHANADHNTISGPGTAAFVEETGTAHATAAITRNSLTSATNTGATTVNGTCNWWGQSTGPVAGQVTGAINASTWLATSDLNGLCAGVPGAPTVTEVFAGPAPDPAPTSVEVAFTPGSTGGNPITSYTATCVGLNESPTGPPAGPTGSASGPGSPILISGLALQGAYQCTVTATNAFGTGPASAPFFVFLGGTGNCAANADRAGNAVDRSGQRLGDRELGTGIG